MNTQEKKAPVKTRYWIFETLNGRTITTQKKNILISQTSSDGPYDVINMLTYEEIKENDNIKIKIQGTIQTKEQCRPITHKKLGIVELTFTPIYYDQYKEIMKNMEGLPSVKVYGQAVNNIGVKGGQASALKKKKKKLNELTDYLEFKLKQLEEQDTILREKIIALSDLNNSVIMMREELDKARTTGFDTIYQDGKIWKQPYTKGEVVEDIGYPWELNTDALVDEEFYNYI